MKKIIYVLGIIGAAFSMTACEPKPPTDPNGLAAMTVGSNQIRFGDITVDVSCRINCNITDESSFYFATGEAEVDDKVFFVRADLASISLNKDIDITEETENDYALGFDYYPANDYDNMICSFGIDCHCLDEYIDEKFYGSVDVIQKGVFRASVAENTMTITLNVLTSDNVVVQAKLVGEIGEW